MHAAEFTAACSPQRAALVFLSEALLGIGTAEVGKFVTAVSSEYYFLSSSSATKPDAATVNSKLSRHLLAFDTLVAQWPLSADLDLAIFE